MGVVHKGVQRNNCCTPLFFIDTVCTGIYLHVSAEWRSALVQYTAHVSQKIIIRQEIIEEERRIKMIDP